MPLPSLSLEESEAQGANECAVRISTAGADEHRTGSVEDAMSNEYSELCTDLLETVETAKGESGTAKAPCSDEVFSESDEAPLGTAELCTD
jgi:hypothetical protein